MSLYNRFYSNIFEISGYPDMVRQYGSFFSHDNCPRGQMFARDHSEVTDMDSLLALMRWVEIYSIIIIIIIK